MYRSVAPKCGVGRLVGRGINEERYAHDIISSEGEPSPKTSGIRSKVNDGLFPCPLKVCEIIAGKLCRTPHLTRKDRDVLVKILEISGANQVERKKPTKRRCFGD